MTTQYKPPPAQFFRATVGVAIINAHNQVLSLERAATIRLPDGELDILGTEQWQLPQTGLRLGEDPRAAALRLIRTDLGLTLEDVELLSELDDWLAFELPPAARSTRHGRGQCQKWFFYRLTTHERRLKLHEENGVPEFVRFRWMRLNALAEITWEPRRAVYAQLSAALSERVSAD